MKRLAFLFGRGGSRAAAGLVMGALWAPGSVEGQVPVSKPPGMAAPQTLRQAADRRGLAVGFFISHYWFLREGDPHYRATVGPYTDLVNRVASREFNTVVMPVFMSSITLKPNYYDWFYPDYTMKCAQKAGMAVQGTPLVYAMPATLPDWVKQLEAKQAWEPLRTAMKNQVTSVVGHYQGRVRSWVVVNEAVDYEASSNGWVLSRNLWQKAFAQNGRPEAYMDEAFIAARNADRGAVLIYNDFANSEVSAKSDVIYGLLKGMKARRVPVDAVGFQMHLSKEGADGWWVPGSINIESFKANMQRFAELGLDIYITELDMKLENTSPESLRLQAEVYAKILEAARTQPRFKGVLQWGLYDKYNWLNDLASEKVKPLHPLMFDTQGRPKPAYYAVREALSK